MADHMIRCWCGKRIDPDDNYKVVWCSKDCWIAEDEYWQLVRLVDFGDDTPE